ncbi:hypothetical protein F5884DRAFT_670696 [Xylogone sp. PMI_703]|nr:hypothetical protein F5884DRAFT_670696 [Xylogone sp. PMI_703]
MSAISNLPAELIEMVANELDTIDFLNFRLVCKEFWSKSFALFLECYFRTRYHTLSRQSLENLVQISRHPILGPSLHILEIGIDHWTDEPPLDAEINVNQQEHRRYLDDQNYLKESGLDTAYLTQIFNNIRNCHTIRLNDNHGAWIFMSQRRQTEVYLTSNIEQHESMEFVKRAIHIILLATIISQLQLKSFGISLGIGRTPISPEMLVLPKPCLEQVHSHLVSLSALELVISPEGGSSRRDWVNNLVNFVHLFQNLEQLDLYFDYRLEHQIFHDLTESLHIRQLLVLCLSGVDGMQDDLARLILSQKDTLKEIQLDIINIIGGGSWPPLIRLMRDQLSLENLVIMECELGGKQVRVRESHNPIIKVSGDWQALTELMESIHPM